jgi:hypothetical protein
LREVQVGSTDFKKATAPVIKTVCDKESDAVMGVASSWKEQQLKEANEQYSLHDMYNVDESALFNKLTLNQHWCSEVKHAHAVKVHKTGLLCCCVKIQLVLINYHYLHSESAETQSVSRTSIIVCLVNIAIM